MLLNFKNNDTMYKNPLKSHYEGVNFDTNVFMPKLSQRLLDTFRLANTTGTPVTVYDIVQIIVQQLYDYLEANQDIDLAVTKAYVPLLREAERAKNGKLN